jgi:hypothetical protein
MSLDPTQFLKTVTHHEVSNVQLIPRHGEINTSNLTEKTVYPDLVTYVSLYPQETNVTFSIKCVAFEIRLYIISSLYPKYFL